MISGFPFNASRIAVKALIPCLCAVFSGSGFILDLFHVKKQFAEPRRLGLFGMVIDYPVEFPQEMCTADGVCNMGFNCNKRFPLYQWKTAIGTNSLSHTYSVKYCILDKQTNFSNNILYRYP